MAYRRKTSARRTRNSARSTYRRRSTSARSTSRARRRSPSRRARSGGQTIRIVLEQPGGASAGGGAMPQNVAAAMRLLAGDRKAAANRVKPKN